MQRSTGTTKTSKSGSGTSKSKSSRSKAKTVVQSEEEHTEEQTNVQVEKKPIRSSKNTPPTTNPEEEKEQEITETVSAPVQGNVEEQDTPEDSTSTVSSAPVASSSSSVVSRSPAAITKEDEDPDSVDVLTPYVLELQAKKGNLLKVIFDIIYNLMKGNLYLIFTRPTIFYSNSDADGLLVMQFKLDGDKVNYQPPAELVSDDLSMVISASPETVQQSTKARVTERMRLYITKEKRHQLCVEITNGSGVSTTNKVPIGDDKGYTPIDTPKYPPSLRPVVEISGKDFAEKCKLTSFGKLARISVQAGSFNQQGCVKILAGDPKVKVSEPTFGTWKEGAPLVFEATFPTAMLARIASCGTISENVRIYAYRDLPLKIISDIGNIGTLYMHLYAKNK